MKDSTPGLSSGSWTVTFGSALSTNGAYTVQVTQGDLAGNSGASAGQTVTIKWTGTEDASLATSFFVDDTALTAS